MPFKTPKALSRFTNATINHAKEPKVKRIYPILNNALATAKLPKILTKVPNQDIKLIIFSKFPCYDIYQRVAHIVS